MPSLLRRESSTLFAPRADDAPSSLSLQNNGSSSRSNSSFVRRSLKRSKPVNRTSEKSPSSAELQVYRSSSEAPVDKTHRIEDDDSEDETDRTMSLSWSSLGMLDDSLIDDHTLPLVIHAWRRCKRRASQQAIGNLLLQRLQQLEPDKCDELLRLKKNKSNSFVDRWNNGVSSNKNNKKNDSTMLLHQMNWHMQALRLAEFVDDLFRTLEHTPDEFKTLLCTFWRQQHTWGWNLQLSHTTALAAAIKMALDEIPSSTTTSNNNNGGSALSDNAYYAIDQLNKTIFLELEQFQKTLVSEEATKQQSRSNPRLGGGFLDPIKW